MEKLNGKNVLILLLPLLLTACQSYKKVPYLQDAEVVLYSTQNEQLYDAKIEDYVMLCRYYLSTF